LTPFISFDDGSPDRDDENKKKDCCGDHDHNSDPFKQRIIIWRAWVIKTHSGEALRLKSSVAILLRLLSSDARGGISLREPRPPEISSFTVPYCGRSIARAFDSGVLKI
jgi:hypothetical protein